MKTKISIEIDAEIYKAFRVKLDASFVKAPMILTCAMNSFAEGLLVQSGRYLVPSGSVARETSTRPVGRPPVKEKETPSKERIAWFDQDHVNKPLQEYPILTEMLAHLDHKEHLQFDTYGEITKSTFGGLCNSYMLVERGKYDERSWNAGRVGWETLQRCARKFMALNRLDLRYDEDTLAEWFYKYNNQLNEEQQEIEERNAKQP